VLQLVREQTNTKLHHRSIYSVYNVDNVDHKLRKIDGLNTFHGMGIIATVTPSVDTVNKVPRIAVTMGDIVSGGRINTKHLTSPCNKLNALRNELLKEHTE
jgi:hypothetical protein